MAKKQSTGSAYGDKMRSDWERTHGERDKSNVQRYNRAKQPSVGEPTRFGTKTAQKLETVPQPKSKVTSSRAVVREEPVAFKSTYSPSKQTSEKRTMPAGTGRTKNGGYRGTVTNNSKSSASTSRGRIEQVFESSAGTPVRNEYKPTKKNRK